VDASWAGSCSEAAPTHSELKCQPSMSQLGEEVHREGPVPPNLRCLHGNICVQARLASFSSSGGRYEYSSCALLWMSEMCWKHLLSLLTVIPCWPRAKKVLWPGWSERLGPFSFPLGHNIHSNTFPSAVCFQTLIRVVSVLLPLTELLMALWTEPIILQRSVHCRSLCSLA